MQDRRTILRLGMLAVGYSLAGGRMTAGTQAWSSDGDLPSYQKAADKIRPLFEKKKAPGEADWLANQHEPGQNFTEYLITNPNSRTAERNKLYLQPIGEFTRAESSVLIQLREFMRLFFGIDVENLDKIGLERIPADARREPRIPGAEQLLTTHILDQILLPKRPKDAVAVLAITASDLWPGAGWNFVFGMASLKERVGVWSTCRFGDPGKEPAKYLRRVLQVAVHETGHMFGIKHCTAYECCMNGSNSLNESDRAPLVYCCECDPKLWWSCKLDPGPRAKALADFSQRHALEREAQQWKRIAKILGTE